MEGKKQNLIKLQNQTQLKLTKRLAGKKGFFGMFSKKSNETVVTELEGKIKECTENIEHVTTLIDIVALIQGYYETAKFKFERARKYFETISKLSEQETAKQEPVKTTNPNSQLSQLLEKIVTNANIENAVPLPDLNETNDKEE